MLERQPFATRLTVALLAAYVLVLQALLGGALAGRHAGLQALDAAIHLTLCDPGGTGAAQPSDGKAPAHLPDCCAQGCQATGTGLAPTAMAVALAYPRTSLAQPRPPTADSSAHPRPERSVASPRAPPARA